MLSTPQFKKSPLTVGENIIAIIKSEMIFITIFKNGNFFNIAIAILDFSPLLYCFVDKFPLFCIASYIVIALPTIVTAIVVALLRS